VDVSFPGFGRSIAKKFLLTHLFMDHNLNKFHAGRALFVENHLADGHLVDSNGIRRDLWTNNCWKNENGKVRL